MLNDTMSMQPTRSRLCIKKNKIMPFAVTWVDLEIVILSEVKDKYRTISLICGILKNGTNELIFKTEIESQM